MAIDNWMYLNLKRWYNVYYMYSLANFHDTVVCEQKISKIQKNKTKVKLIINITEFKNLFLQTETITYRT